MSGMKENKLNGVVLVIQMISLSFPFSYNLGRLALQQNLGYKILSIYFTIYFIIKRYIVIKNNAKSCENKICLEIKKQFIVNRR